MVISSRHFWYPINRSRYNSLNLSSGIFNQPVGILYIPVVQGIPIIPIGAPRAEGIDTLPVVPQIITVPVNTARHRPKTICYSKRPAAFPYAAIYLNYSTFNPEILKFRKYIGRASRPCPAYIPFIVTRALPCAFTNKKRHLVGFLKRIGM